jgi:hypothetical protein
MGENTVWYETPETAEVIMLDIRLSCQVDHFARHKTLRDQWFQLHPFGRILFRARYFVPESFEFRLVESKSFTLCPGKPGRRERTSKAFILAASAPPSSFASTLTLARSGLSVARRFCPTLEGMMPLALRTSA